MDRVTELTAIYEQLKAELADAKGSGAAALGRELRILAAELDRLAPPKETSKVDEVGERRKARAGAARAPARRRQSRRGA